MLDVPAWPSGPAFLCHNLIDTASELAFANLRRFAQALLELAIGTAAPCVTKNSKPSFTTAS